MSALNDGRATRRSFTEDFKAGAVRRVLDEGQTVAAATRDRRRVDPFTRHRVIRHTRVTVPQGMFIQAVG